MIDIHCHLLNGIDDGAHNLEDTLEMAKLAVSEGISHILATPHHKNGRFDNYKQEIIVHTNKVQEELDNNNIPLTIFPGQEIRIHGEIFEGIKNDDILFADEMNRYLLIEFPTMSIPHYAELLFFQLVQNGITPIIVHPERNQEIIAYPNKLLDFVEKGALAQLTASSYVGIFGKKIEQLSKQLIESNLVHVLASDAHNTKGRSFHMKSAFEKLEKEFDTEKVQLFNDNAKSIINGEFVICENATKVKKKNKWFIF